MPSGRQTVHWLIIFQHTCMPAILFWAYLYAGPSNFLGALAKFSLTEALPETRKTDRKPPRITPEHCKSPPHSVVSSAAACQPYAACSLTTVT